MRKRGNNKIGWCHETRNPIAGCLHGCGYCYMRDFAQRFPKTVSMKPTLRIHQLDKMLRELDNTPPSRVFVGSSGDMWGKWVPPWWIERVLEICRQVPQHRFIFLTKNPTRYGEFDIPPYCWCGTSMTGSREEENRLKDLYDNAPTLRRFISLEPYTGIWPIPQVIFSSFNWLIVGGLTGKGAKYPPRLCLDNIVMNASKSGIPLFIKDNAGYSKMIQEYPENLQL